MRFIPSEELAGGATLLFDELLELFFICLDKGLGN